MVRQLIMVLGDQLSEAISCLNDVDPEQDMVLMAEVMEESTRVPSHKVRTTVFLSAMRHFRDQLQARGIAVDYVALDEPANRQSLAAELERALERHQPDRVILTRPGEWQIAQDLEARLNSAEVPFEIREDDRFLCSVAEFQQHAKGRKQLRMEFFYREMRRHYNVLMEGDQPTGGQWNFDASNRGTFGRKGPGKLPELASFPPDDITRQVMALVETHLPDNPGSLEGFDWPVTSQQAHTLLDTFIKKALPDFGQYQDAMWSGEPYLYHSRLSSAMNLKLLSPITVVEKVEEAYRAGHVPIEAAEGYIRQVLGWREYIRGMYWLLMPDYLEMNALNAREPLPPLYWSANTAMACLKDTVEQTLRHGYAHHIQRLMVTGLFALLVGVQPRAIHQWYLAVYLDAVEWVELPNTLGMSQFVDGGRLASKPYVATGKYIQRMSNYCKGCRFDPAESTGETACPFTTLYWDFLLTHEDTLRTNQRMTLQLRNLNRLSEERKQAIRSQAASTRMALHEEAL